MDRQDTERQFRQNSSIPRMDGDTGQTDEGIKNAHYRRGETVKQAKALVWPRLAQLWGGTERWRYSCGGVFMLRTKGLSGHHPTCCTRDRQQNFSAWIPMTMRQLRKIAERRLKPLCQLVFLVRRQGLVIVKKCLHGR